MRTEFYRRADTTTAARKVRKQFHERRQVLLGQELCVLAIGGAVV